MLVPISSPRRSIVAGVIGLAMATLADRGTVFRGVVTSASRRTRRPERRPAILLFALGHINRRARQGDAAAVCAASLHRHVVHFAAFATGDSQPRGPLPLRLVRLRVAPGRDGADGVPRRRKAGATTPETRVQLRKPRTEMARFAGRAAHRSSVSASRPTTHASTLPPPTDASEACSFEGAPAS